MWAPGKGGRRQLEKTMAWDQSLSNPSGTCKSRWLMTRPWQHQCVSPGRPSNFLERSERSHIPLFYAFIPVCKVLPVGSLTTSSYPSPSPLCTSASNLLFSPKSKWSLPQDICSCCFPPDTLLPSSSRGWLLVTKFKIMPYKGLSQHGQAANIFL